MIYPVKSFLTHGPEREANLKARGVDPRISLHVHEI